MTRCGAGGELPGGLRGEEDPHRVGALFGVIEHHGCVELGFGDREQLHDDGLRLGIPAQPHRADPELRVDRSDQGAEVFDLGLRRQRRAEPAVDLDQQRGDPLGQHRDLLFFQDDGDDPLSCTACR